MARSSTTSRTGRIAFGVGMAVILALFALLPARSDVRIVSSPGGAVDAYLAAFCPRATVRRTGRHRRALPVRLHTGAEHDPPQSYLRHAAGGARLPRPAMVLPTHRLYGARAGGHPYRHRLLSPRCTRLDQKTGRANAEAHLSSRQGACGSLSALLANVRWLTNPGVGCSNPSRPVRMEYKALANSTQRGL